MPWFEIIYGTGYYEDWVYHATEYLDCEDITKAYEIAKKHMASIDCDRIKSINQFKPTKGET